MREEEMTRLVSAVTEQVLRALGQSSGDCAEDSAGLTRVLVLGALDGVPEPLLRRCKPLALEDYCRCGNILKYDRVIVLRLTMLQLSSLALGLPADDACRAVMDALLNGVEVLMPEDAPEHRACAGRGSAALYGLLEGYVRQLRIFGVKPLEGALGRAAETTFEPKVPQEHLAPRPGYECHATPNFDRLITEEAARRLCAEASGQVRLAPGTLITPAAKDVFAAEGITVVIGR